MSTKEFLRSLIPNNLVNAFWHLPKAVFASLVYGFPGKKLKIIGVTGTDGKTTTATLIYHILSQTGKKAALISTVSARLGKKEIDIGFHVTTPNPFDLQKLLKKILKKDYKYLVLESTSHGFAQYRLWGIDFLAGVVTNITEDHFLYHKNWDNYARAKAKLFRNTKYSILNIEDKSYSFLKTKASGKIITYGLKKGDFNLKNFKFETRLPGNFNKLNCLAAASAAQALGIGKETVKKALADFPGVKGRMEVMQQKPFKVIVDFAHTPNALNQALKTLRKKVGRKGRLISVFGCAGLRDKNRRKMGMVSAQLADITVITAEDPRTEGVEKISEEIAFWAKKGRGKFVKIPDRGKAIEFAIKIAKKGDVVGIFGKGHERSMCFGAIEKPWSDQEAIKKILRGAGLVKKLKNSKMKMKS